MQKTGKTVRQGKFFVYIIACNQGPYYTGSTSDLERRLKGHAKGKRGAKYLRGKTPVTLVYAKGYRYYKSAVKEERRIKRLRRYQKLQLIEDYAQR